MMMICGCVFVPMKMERREEQKRWTKKKFFSKKKTKNKKKFSFFCSLFYTKHNTLL